MESALIISNTTCMMAGIFFSGRRQRWWAGARPEFFTAASLSFLRDATFFTTAIPQEWE